MPTVALLLPIVTDVELTTVLTVVLPNVIVLENECVLVQAYCASTFVEAGGLIQYVLVPLDANSWPAVPILPFDEIALTVKVPVKDPLAIVIAFAWKSAILNVLLAVSTNAPFGSGARPSNTFHTPSVASLKIPACLTDPSSYSPATPRSGCVADLPSTVPPET